MKSIIVIVSLDRRQHCLLKRPEILFVAVKLIPLHRMTNLNDFFIACTIAVFSLEKVALVLFSKKRFKAA